MDLPYGRLKTTVIGSFPLEHSPDNMRRVFFDQIEAGVNFPCYGQLLDMNLMFLDPLAKEGCGIEVKGKEAWITGPLEPPRHPVALEFLKAAQTHLEEACPEWVDGIKVPVTGPITLASVTKVSEKHHAIEHPEFIEGFSEIVTEIVRGYDEAGAALITIDEPSLSYAKWLGIDSDVLVEALNKPIRAVKSAFSSVHVCGDISTVASTLLQTEAPILDHSFKNFPANLEAYSKSTLEKADKMIGFGCVAPVPEPRLLLDIASGKTPWTDAVEPIDEVEKLIVKGGERFGLERLIIVPDCGFGGMRGYFKDDTGQRIAAQKLKNMVAATKRVSSKF
jgi:5-methyltetrahydropteroyltriglutamate--homocysteine methyltransferase